MFSPNPKNDPLLAAIKGVIAENDKHRDAVDLVNHYFQITDKRQLPHNLHSQYDKMLSESKVIAEKITKSTPMRDVIRDFEKSDAPQFEGKSMEKRRQMAIAAKMAMNEALKGNQHKIDANKNGKVDAQDFKMLRKDMTAEEIMMEAIFNLSEKDSLSEAEVNFLMDIFSEEVKYKVKKGDTLYDLAKEYGTTVDAIAKASGVKNKNKISIDQELVIPGQAAPIPDEPSSSKAPIPATMSPKIDATRKGSNSFPTATIDGQTYKTVPDIATATHVSFNKSNPKGPANRGRYAPPVLVDKTPVTARPDTQTGAGAKFGQTDTSPPSPPLPRTRPTPKSPTPPVPVDANTVRDSQKRYALDMFKNVANAADFDGEKFVDDLTSRYNSKVEPRDVKYDALKIQSSDDTKSILAQSLGIPYPELTRILGRSKAPVTATPDKQTGAGGDYSQAVKSTKPASGLTTRNVTTVPVDKYGNLTPRTSTDPVAAAKATAAQAGAEADALQRQFQTRKTASDLAIFRKADSQSMAGIKPSSQMPSAAYSRGAADADAAVRKAAAQNTSAFSRGASDANAAVAYSRGAADADAAVRKYDAQNSAAASRGASDANAAVRQAAAQRTVDSTTAALSANDRGSNMTSSAASIEAQRLASRIATKKLEAQKNEIIKVPANSYQPETRAAQLYRIDNIGREVTKRREEGAKKTDLQTNLNTYVNR